MEWIGAVVALCFLGLLVVQRSIRPTEPLVPRVPPTLDADTAQQISDLVAGGRQVEAIKALRRATGLGLLEAKEWIDAWNPDDPDALTRAASAQGPDPAVLQAIDAEARAARETSGPIAAIKVVRERTGWGLADAKAYVDRLA